MTEHAPHGPLHSVSALRCPRWELCIERVLMGSCMTAADAVQCMCSCCLHLVAAQHAQSEKSQVSSCSPGKLYICDQHWSKTGGAAQADPPGPSGTAAQASAPGEASKKRKARGVDEATAGKGKTTGKKGISKEQRTAVKGVLQVCLSVLHARVPFHTVKHPDLSLQLWSHLQDAEPLQL